MFYTCTFLYVAFVLYQWPLSCISGLCPVCCITIVICFIYFSFTFFQTINSFLTLLQYKLKWHNVYEMSIFTLYHVYSPNRVKLTSKYQLSNMDELTHTCITELGDRQHTCITELGDRQHTCITELGNRQHTCFIKDNDMYIYFSIICTLTWL
jgi:hypothetical protein